MTLAYSKLFELNIRCVSFFLAPKLKSPVGGCGWLARLNLELPIVYRLVLGKSWSRYSSKTLV